MSITLEVSAATNLVSTPLSSGAHSGAHAAQRRRQDALVALGRRVIAPPDVALLVQDAAALIAETLDVEQYGIAILQDGNRLRLRVRSLAAGGAAHDEQAARQTFVAAARDESLAGFALATAETLGVVDLRTERRFSDRWLVDQQLYAGVAVPLQLRDESYGALLALSAQPREFTIDDILFAETIGHMVSTTIGRDRALKLLEHERNCNRTVWETVESLVMVLAPSGRISRVNGAFARTVGYLADEVRERPIWNFLLAPEEVAAVQAILRRSAREPEPVEHESFVLTQRGERRRVRWTYATLNPASGEGAMIVATGIDVTALRDAESRLQRLQPAGSAAEQAVAKPLAGPTSEAAPAEHDPSGRPFHPLPPGAQGDRRKRPRRAFSYFQRIAPYQDQKLPPPAMFREVRCCDISAGGFSFVSQRPPEHTDYVVALGAAPVVIHLAVRVAHITPQQFEGRDAFLVGCTYVGRVDY